MELAPLRGVLAQYGAREVGRAAGIIKTEGSNNELVIDLTGQLLNDGLVLPLVVPDGSVFTGIAKLLVSEAFDLAAASVVEVGEQGLEATNGVSLLEVDLESTGNKDVSGALAGEWAVTSQVAGNHTVDIVFSAGSVADATVGRAKLILEYIHLA